MSERRLIKTVVYDIVEGNKDRGRSPKRLIDNITDWTELNFVEALTDAERETERVREIYYGHHRHYHRYSNAIS